jgi:hypothetical protein
MRATYVVLERLETQLEDIFSRERIELEELEKPPGFTSYWEEKYGD